MKVQLCSDHYSLQYGEIYEIDEEMSVIDMYALIDHNHQYLHAFVRKECCAIVFDPLWDPKLKELFQL